MSAFILLLPFMLALISHSPTPDSSSKLLITEFSILNSPTPLFITADPITSKFLISISPVPLFKFKTFAFSLCILLSPTSTSKSTLSNTISSGI